MAEPDDWDRRFRATMAQLERDAVKRQEEDRDFLGALAEVNALRLSGRKFDAERRLVELVEVRKTAHSTDHELEFMSIVRWLNWTQRPDESDFAVRTAYAEARSRGDPRGAHVWAQQLQRQLLSAKRWDAAATIQEEIVLHAEALFGEPATSTALAKLEKMASWVPDPDPTVAERRRDLAVAVLSRSVATFEHDYPPDHPLTGDAHLRLGFALAKVGRFGDAAEHLERGLAICGPDTPLDVDEARRLLEARS